MTMYAVLDNQNECVDSAWFGNAISATHHMTTNYVKACDFHVGEVCPNHDEVGRIGCKYCARKSRMTEAEQQLAMSRAITDCIHLRRPFSLISANVRGTYNEVAL